MTEASEQGMIDQIREQTDAIISSGILGRSRFYQSLLEYLVENAAHGHTPKEVEIAAEVFRRGETFDPTQDSMVRVYVHNLRQKLHQYYQGAGSAESHRLTIPKGEYRVLLETPGQSGDATEDERPLERARVPMPAGLRAAALAVLGVAVGFAAASVLSPPESEALARYEAVAQSPFWSRMLDDDRPIVIVVGDYYIFGELGPDGNVDRLVREFAINSSRDLDELMMHDPGFADRHIDLDLTYLPSSTAFAMHELLRIVYTTDKPVSVVSMSNLDAMDIRDNHVIYVGYLSALDKLIDFVFTSSELAIGSTYDELVNTVTGESYVSEAGIPTQRRNYRDYGLVSVFPGPNGNEFLILAGTRDEGMMHSAQAVSEPTSVTASVEAVTEALGHSPDAFEVLYEVAGFDRTNLDASIVHIAPLKHEAIWTGDLSLPD